MNITITYCGVWNYLPRASRVEDEIKEAFSDVKIDLIESSGGVFDVTLNGSLIFSKLQRIGTDSQRFPFEGEIVALIKKAL